MKTFTFFRYDNCQNPPTVSVFPITFDDTGAMAIAMNEVPHGLYVLENEKILERISPEEQFEIPIITTVNDPKIRIFDTAGSYCIASPDRYLIGLMAYFFRHGFNFAVASITSMAQEMHQEF